MQPVASACSEAELWRRLRASGDAAARAELLRLHLPYAKVVAASYYGRRFHDEVEFGDYLQLASIGLLEAFDRFDPARGVQFRTFAARRMHGAILNGLERLTEKQQQVAARQRLRRERVQEVKALAGDGVEPVAPGQLLRFIADTGIGLALCWMLEGTALVQDADAGDDQPFYRDVAMRQLRQRIVHAVDALPAPEKVVVRSHYLQEVPLAEVAAMLHLTRGRVSQIHRRALLRLRALVREDADWTASF
jgi:RNA polymerase sigma factor for flagellar operon FliA